MGEEKGEKGEESMGGKGRGGERSWGSEGMIEKEGEGENDVELLLD